jgi:hypothetical protein
MGEDAKKVQLLLDIYTETFAQVDLKMNAGKTKTMIMSGGEICQALSVGAYSWRIEGIG